MAITVPNITGALTRGAITVSGITQAASQLIHWFKLITNLNDSASSDTMTLARASSKTFIPDSGSVTTVTTNNAAFTGSGVLIEKSHTNKLTYSQQFDNAAWTKDQANITANSTTDPLGTTTADTITATVDASTSLLRYTAILATTGNDVLISGFFKKGVGNGVRLEITNNGVTVVSWLKVDLRDGSTSTGGGGFTILDSGTTDCGSGWYYCYMVVTLAGAFAQWQWRAYQWNPDTDSLNVAINDTIYAWQADFQETSYGSPVPTTTAAATSLKDDYTMALDEIPDNDFFVELDWTPLSDADGYLFSFSNASDGIILFYDESASELKATSIGEGSATLSAFNPTIGTSYKVRVEKSSAAGMSLEVVGVNSTTNASLTANVAFPAEGNIGSLYNDTGHSHSVIANDKVGDA